jgi:hypothetical protein
VAVASAFRPAAKIQWARGSCSLYAECYKHGGPLGLQAASLRKGGSWSEEEVQVAGMVGFSIREARGSHRSGLCPAKRCCRCGPEAQLQILRPDRVRVRWLKWTDTSAHLTARRIMDCVGRAQRRRRFGAGSRLLHGTFLTPSVTLTCSAARIDRPATQSSVAKRCRAALATALQMGARRTRPSCRVAGPRPSIAGLCQYSLRQQFTITRSARTSPQTGRNFTFGRSQRARLHAADVTTEGFPSQWTFIVPCR